MVKLVPARFFLDFGATKASGGDSAWAKLRRGNTLQSSKLASVTTMNYSDPKMKKIFTRR